MARWWCGRYVVFRGCKVGGVNNWMNGFVWIGNGVRGDDDDRRVMKAS